MTDVTDSSPENRVYNRAYAQELGADCENCPLRTTGKFVPSAGPAQADIAFVGEGPGVQEAKQGRPFIGPSGRLLTLVNNQFGIKREEVFLTNASLCRPIDGSTPPKSAVAACRPRLLRELSERGTRTVVALGNSAALSVLGVEGVTKLRVGPGRTSPYPELDGARVIPTVHPAACVDGATRILTANLEWIAARDIHVGDELIGFDEEPVEGQRRKWRRSVVTEAYKQMTPRYKITLKSGKELTCSDDHLWLTKHHGYGNYKWCTPEQLRKRIAGGYYTTLLKSFEPWKAASGQEAGYIAGFLDGEGSWHQQDGISWGQNDGEVAEYVVRLFKEFGFVVRSSKGYDGIHKYTGNQESGKCKRYNLGGRKAGIRAAGMFRPIRLMPKVRNYWEGNGFYAEQDPIAKVEKIENGEVVVINTTTRTYIAEGYLSHNCLRQSDMFPSLVADVRKVVTEPPKWDAPKIYVIDEPEAAIEWLGKLKRFAEDETVDEWDRRVVIDIEVDIDKENSFDHPDRYGLLCVGFCIQKGIGIVIGEEALRDERVLDAMSDALQNAYLVGQNGKFDLAGMHPHLGSLRLSFDTMIANYAQDERPGIHGLKFQSVETLGAPQYDEEIKKYVGPRDGYGVIPRNLLYTYNGYDVVCTYDLSEVHAGRMDALRRNEERTWPYYDEGLPVKGVRDVHDFLVEASNELMFVELNGIAVDRTYANEVSAEYTKSIGKLEERINLILSEAVFPFKQGRGGKHVAFNPRSPQQVKEALAFFRVKVDSTNEETLRLILDKLDGGRNAEGQLTVLQELLYQFVEVLLVHRRESKLHSTYVKGVIKRLYRGRVYPTFLVHGTTTGRLSCRNPNLQNIPRESSIRKLFVPGKPENLFVQADFSQAELRVLTWLAKDEYFRAILNDPKRDLFDELTPILYPELPAKDQVPAALWKETRIRVKAFVYGLGYGRTEFSIAKEYKLPVREAEAVKNRFFDTIPSIVQWQKDVKDKVWRGEDLITPFGRHRRFHLITEDNWQSIKNEAMAFLPQSTSSDICLRAMVRVRRDLRGTGAYVRNIVHDSILVDCPADMANDVAVLLDKHMVESAHELVGDYVEFRTDYKIGEHWGLV